MRVLERHDGEWLIAFLGLSCDGSVGRDDDAAPASHRRRRGDVARARLRDAVLAD